MLQNAEANKTLLVHKLGEFNTFIHEQKQLMREWEQKWNVPLACRDMSKDLDEFVLNKENLRINRFRLNISTKSLICNHLLTDSDDESDHSTDC